MQLNTTRIAFLACLAAGLVQAQGNQGTGYLFLSPGAQSQGSRLVSYVNASNNLNLALDGNGPTGAYQVIAKPDGSRFYILGSGATSALQSVNSTFTAFNVINGLPTTPTTLAMTPNGRYLLTGANELNIIDTDTNGIVGSNISTTGSVAGITTSRDSTRAFVVTNTAFGSIVSTYDIATRARVGNQLNLTGGASGITLSPQGRLYVSAINRIYEIVPNGSNLALATGPGINSQEGGIATFGTIGPLKFTPDGTTAYSINATPNSGGGSLLKFTTSTRTIASWPPFSQTPPLFSDVYVAGNDRVFAYAPQTTTLWDVTPGPFGAAESALGSLVQIHNVLGVALSNEVPSAKYLFLTVGNFNSATIYRIDLSTNSQSLQVLSTFSSNSLNFVNIPAQTAANFYLLNNFQVVQPEAQSLPLIARVLDAANRPVYNVPVTFSNANVNLPVTINNPSGTTDADGYVQTTIIAPIAPGPYVINLTASGVTTPFTISVPGQGTGGGGGGGGGGGNGGGGGVTQLQKVNGDGLLLEEFSFTPFYAQPTVRVTDLDGKPLANVSVSFTVTAGAATIGIGSTNTDENGLASTTVNVSQNNPGVIFQSSIITAATQFGSTDFYITTYHLNQDRSGTPDILLIKPDTSTVVDLSGGAGELLPNAFTFQINSANSPQIGVPMPNIGVRLSSYSDASKPGPAACEGSNLSTAQGQVSCNMRLGCTVGTTGMQIIIGEYRSFYGQVTVSAGKASKIALIGGDNQTGRAGALLPLTLTALTTDGCGQTTAGAPVTWKVTQGSATLEQTVSTSDFGGRVNTRVRLGQTAGPGKVEVSLANGGKLTFNFTIEVVVGNIRLISGDAQTALVNTQFTNPLTFEVRDINNNPIGGAPVNFIVSNGAVQLSATSANTDALGRASVTVTASSTSGPVVVTGSYSGFAASANLTVRPPGPSITSASFVNAASEIPGLAVCGLGIVRGAGLVPNLSGIASASNIGPLPYTLGGVSMSINGIPVPLQSVSNLNNVQQVNFQTPCELLAGSGTVSISVGGSVPTVVQNVPILAAQPGIFTYAGPNSRLYGAVIRAADGSYVTPSNYLRRGEPYYLVVTGLGQTTPNTLTNSAGTGTQLVNVPVLVGVNNAGVSTGRVFYLAGTIGVYLIEFQVPINSATGPDQPLVTAVTVNGQISFSNSVFLPGVQ